VQEAKALAYNTLRAVRADRITREALANNSPDDAVFAASEPIGEGRKIDAFCSHSWHDPVDEKWEALQAWRRAFVAKHSREPLMWVDKYCISPQGIDEQLASLPVNLMACDAMLALVGPTYLTRLWCVLELWLFHQIGAEPHSLQVRVLETSAVTSEADAEEYLPAPPMGRLRAPTVEIVRPSVADVQPIASRTSSLMTSVPVEVPMDAAAEVTACTAVVDTAAPSSSRGLRVHAPRGVALERSDSQGSGASDMPRSPIEPSQPTGASTEERTRTPNGQTPPHSQHSESRDSNYSSSSRRWSASSWSRKGQGSPASSAGSTCRHAWCRAVTPSPSSSSGRNGVGEYAQVRPVPGLETFDVRDAHCAPNHVRLRLLAIMTAASGTMDACNSELRLFLRQAHEYAQERSLAATLAALAGTSNHGASHGRSRHASRVIRSSTSACSSTSTAAAETTPVVAVQPVSGE